ncbi:hypothetical protein NMY22_g18214 [Coprinellus aureogranulatus]|nr:hypothetical protein NMY22_g18214 [Coprinellus aureogranulatus]
MYFRIPRAIYNPGRDAPPKNACFLSTGVACYSHLCTPYISTVNHQTIEDRRIGLYPIEYEFQRSLAYFGTAANKESLRYSFSGGALHFMTRTKEFSARLAPRSLRNDDSFLGLHSLGDQNDAIFNVVTRNFPHALNFGCFVPVFDARRSTFVFNEGHFHSLASLPLFSGEVPHGALVTVGYTTCVFHELRTDPTVPTSTGIAMFFVQFVVLHSL